MSSTQKSDDSSRPMFYPCSEPRPVLQINDSELHEKGADRSPDESQGMAHDSQQSFNASREDSIPTVSMRHYRISKRCKPSNTVTGSWTKQAKAMARNVAAEGNRGYANIAPSCAVYTADKVSRETTNSQQSVESAPNSTKDAVPLRRSGRLKNKPRKTYSDSDDLGVASTTVGEADRSQKRL